MTTRGKFVLTVLILAVVSVGVWRWWDKIAPAGKSQQASGNFQELKKSLDAPKPSPEKAAADVASKLLAGEKAVSLVDGSAIPPVSGVSDYDKPMKNGKLIVQSPGYVTIVNEMIHDARVIPVDGRPHASQRMRFWEGDGTTTGVASTGRTRSRSIRPVKPARSAIYTTPCRRGTRTSRC